MIKLGSVPFLNVRPLVFPLEEGLVEHDFEIMYTPPSDLSKMLLAQKVDLGLIPVAELIRSDNYSVVPNISISSFGKVESVVLVSKSGISEMETIAVDSRSRSSTALLRVILEVFNGIFPTYVTREPDDRFLNSVDGGMLIGNTGLKINNYPPRGYKLFDLGEIWTDKTGLPFVYAVYAVNKDVHLGKNLQALQTAKSVGLRLVNNIAKIESEKIGLSEEICLRYLTERIRYGLGEREIRGITAFGKFLSKLEEIEFRDLRIYSE